MLVTFGEAGRLQLADALTETGSERQGEHGVLLCKFAVYSWIALAWDDAVKSCAAFVDKHEDIAFNFTFFNLVLFLAEC